MSYSKRIPSLDGFRGVAAIAVMLYHFNIFFLPQSRLSDIVPFVGRAYLAVDLFFLLSGFVMAHVYGRGLASNWRAWWPGFAVARFARIYPLFAFATLAMMIIFALSGRQIGGVSFSGSSALLQPFLLQQWARGLSWNYPSWSISTEAEAYFVFVFFAGALVTGKHPRLMAACFAAIVAGMSIASPGGSLNHYRGLPALLRTLAEFSLGVLLYRAQSKGAGSLGKWAAISAVLFVGLAVATHFDFLTVGAFACLILYGANGTNAFARLLDSRPLVALGKWSYSIYLLHAPTHYAVMAAFAASGNPVSNLGLSSARLLLLATMLLVVGFSAVNYKYFGFVRKNRGLSPALVICQASDRARVRGNGTYGSRRIFS
jgi:peptidoglycan/LPS O-acetylase OafA/YrhL